MNTKHDRRLHATLRRIAADVEVMIEDKRAAAGFHALEALEAHNQDADEQRAQAKELAAQASGCFEVLQMIVGELAEAR